MTNVEVWFGEPIHGWLPVTVIADSVYASFDASDIYPSLACLVTALTSLTGPTADQTVIWTIEPTEYDFTFCRLADGNISLIIREYPDDRRTQSTVGRILLNISGDYSTICLPFWRALCELKTRMPIDECRIHWSDPFPDSELYGLGERLRDLNMIA